MGSRDAVRVLIADDHESFVDALEAILSCESAIEVVGRAGNGAEAARLAAELEPDVVLMDISMPVLDGFGATKLIRTERPETCVVFLTGSAAEDDRARARELGATAYVTKDRIADELVEAVVAASPPCVPLS